MLTRSKKRALTKQPLESRSLDLDRPTAVSTPLRVAFKSFRKGKTVKSKPTIESAGPSRSVENSSDEDTSSSHIYDDVKPKNMSEEQLVQAVHNLTCNVASLSDTPKGAITFPVFKGDENEDVHEFIANFTRTANFCQWTNERKALGLPLYLKDSANVWFNSIDARDMTFSEIVDALIQQFSSGATTWRIRQKLSQRKQGDKEPLADYVNEIRKMCMRLDLPKDQWLFYFIQGLKESIKSHVILNQPENFEEAVNLAKLKETVDPLSSPSIVDPKEISVAVAEQLKKILTPSVGAFQSGVQSSVPSSFPQRSDNNELRRMIQEEIRKSVPRSQRDQQNSPQDFRSRRSGRGNPICNNCGIVGHTYYNCRKPRGMSPRIPNRQSFGPPFRQNRGSFSNSNNFRRPYQGN